MPQIDKNNMQWLFIIGILLVILDFTVFNPGLIFLLFISAGFIYFGKKRKSGQIGRILFWTGIFFLIMAIISSFIFKFVLFALLIYAVYQFMESKKEEKLIQPKIIHGPPSETGEKVIRKKPLLRNVFFGRQSTPEYIYEWNDINIQTGIGDCVIDLSNTVLPDGVAVIAIQSIAGNIQILIPYEQEVSIHSTIISGSFRFFSETEPKVFNQTIYMQTENFDQAENKIKIVTSLLVGKVEVKRI